MDAAYQEALRMWTEARSENVEVQRHLITHFLERETPEEREGRREVSAPAGADDRQRYQKCFAELFNLKALHHGIREDACRRYEALKAQHENTELLANEEWQAFRAVQLSSSRDSRSRAGEAMDEKMVQAALDKTEERLLEWRKCNQEDIAVASKKFRLEEKLLEQKELAGKSESGALLFQELKAELTGYQHKLKKQEHDLHHLAQREKNSVNEITHMSEKLEYLESLKESVTDKLKDSESHLGQCKQRMFNAHVKRDAERKRKSKLVESSELLTRQKMTADFQRKVQTRNNLIREIQASKREFCQHVPCPSAADQKLLDKPELPVLKEDFNDPSTLLEICQYESTLLVCK